MSLSKSLAQKGDMLKVTYESDFVLPENAPASLQRAVKSEESWIWLSEPEQIPGVLAALTGAKKDGEYTFKAEFPPTGERRTFRENRELQGQSSRSQRRVAVEMTPSWLKNSAWKMSKR